MGCAAMLILLWVIDLKHRLLPNVFVAGFAVCGVVFHLSTQMYFTSYLDALIGVLIGGGLLLGIRMIGNAYYKQDTLGLGDVKLMAAAGLWLGQSYILHALVIGALAGLVHGLGMMGIRWTKTRKLESISTFSLPAGPGFIVGIIIAGVAKFSGLPHLLFP